MNCKLALIACIVIASFISQNANAQASQSCNCVSFRIDNVQDYYIPAVQQAILNVFAEQRTPVTIGIIANAFGRDSTMYSYVSGIIKNPSWSVEVASNGYDATTLYGLSYDQQRNQLALANTRLQTLLYIPPPRVFIPQGSSYDQNTVEALQSLHFTHVSSTRDFDSLRPYALSGQTFYRVPSGAPMQYFQNGMSLGYTADQVFQQVKYLQTVDGFAVVLINPATFALYQNKDMVNQVNTTMISELRKLIQTISSNGIKITQTSTINSDWMYFPTPPMAMTNYNCTCVAFRLEGVQDFFLTTQQTTVMGLFKQYNIPLTIGVIANGFGNDYQIVNYVTGALSDAVWKVEVAANGYNLEDFSALNYNNQNALLAQINNKISSILKVTPKTMIMPGNTFNNMTMSALINNGYKVMSSSVVLDTPPYTYESPDLWHLPSGASTSDKFQTQYMSGIPASQTLSDIYNQLQLVGFAVVSIHPQEFSHFDGVQYNADIINQTMVNHLSNLLSTMKTSGLTTCLMSSASGLFSTNQTVITVPPSTTPSPTSPSPSPSDTPSPSPATTTGAPPDIITEAASESTRPFLLAILAIFVAWTLVIR